jgi:hypothetical protein
MTPAMTKTKKTVSTGLNLDPQYTLQASSLLIFCFDPDIDTGGLRVPASNASGFTACLGPLDPDPKGARFFLQSGNDGNGNGDSKASHSENNNDDSNGKGDDYKRETGSEGKGRGDKGSDYCHGNDNDDDGNEGGNNLKVFTIVLNRSGNAIALNRSGNAIVLSRSGNAIALNSSGNTIILNRSGNAIALNSSGNAVVLNRSGNAIALNSSGNLGHGCDINGKGSDDDYERVHVLPSPPLLSS